MLHKPFTSMSACCNFKTLYIYIYSGFDYEPMWWLDLNWKSQQQFSITFFSLSVICVVLQNKPNFALNFSLCFISDTQLLLLQCPILAKGCSAVFTVFSIEQAQNSIRHKKQQTKYNFPFTNFFHHTYYQQLPISRAYDMTSSVS